MLSEHDERYLESITGNAERTKARQALVKFESWLLAEHGRNEPIQSDIREYQEYLTGKGISLKTVKDTMRRISNRYRVKDTKEGEQIQMSFEETTTETHTTVDTLETKSSKAGRKRFDTENGEKRSEKLMLYLTPELITDIRDWCNLKGISYASFVIGLIEDYLRDKKNILNTFREFRDKA